MEHQQIKTTQKDRRGKSGATIKQYRLVSASLPSHLYLPRILGNQAFGRFFQAKLTVNQPGDMYEQEADRVTEQVMRMPEPLPALLSSIDAIPHVQRKCAACSSGGSLCPKCAEEETFRAKEAPGANPAVSPTMENHINAMRDGGQPLPLPVRAFFEPRFRYDFSQVRVHTDGQAAESARAVNARAYTVGRDVVFGAGQYSPDSAAGKSLLAHELTHVVQQSHHYSHSLALQRRNSVSLSPKGGCKNVRAIADAIPGAREMADTALNKFLSFTSRARIDLLLRANFLSDNDVTHGIVKDRIISIREFLDGALVGRVTFVCAPATDPDCSNREGYVLDTERNRIHICNPFFGLTVEGRRWMLIHECAHLAGARKLPELYWGFFGPIGESECRQLTSSSSTDAALGNADNYARLIWCLARQPGIEITPP